MSCEKNVLVGVDLMGPEDLPEILEIERDSYPSPWTRGMFEGELKTRHAQCLTAKMQIEGRTIIAGYIVFWLVADEAHLHNLAVRRQCRRQKLGWNLMALMRRIAYDLGIRKITLEVRASNMAAIELYRQCGFVVKGRRPNYYSDTHEDALIMWADDIQDRKDA